MFPLITNSYINSSKAPIDTKQVVEIAVCFHLALLKTKPLHYPTHLKFLFSVTITHKASVQLYSDVC
jgi:hypothetical protein